MKKIKNILVGFSVLALLTVPVFAAENGCDNDDNDMIVAELALCSTHAYNIGNTENPTGANKGLMRDVIAMKTTVITQQMYKQYEQMESMLRRLKTQLEKAVLTSSLEAKGASSGSSSSGGDGFKSPDKNIYMAGIKNCLNFYQDSEILKCYEDNLTVLVNMSQHGSEPTSEMKKQLAHDYDQLVTQNFGGNCGTPENVCLNKDRDNKDKQKMMSKSDFNKCLNDARLCLQNQYRAYNNSQKMQKK